MVSNINLYFFVITRRTVGLSSIKVSHSSKKCGNRTEVWSIMCEEILISRARSLDTTLFCTLPLKHEWNFFKSSQNATIPRRQELSQIEHACHNFHFGSAPFYGQLRSLGVCPLKQLFQIVSSINCISNFFFRSYRLPEWNKFNFRLSIEHILNS